MNMPADYDNWLHSETAPIVWDCKEDGHYWHRSGRYSMTCRICGETDVEDGPPIEDMLEEGPDVGWDE